jgi:class 3 adenylate cyclase
MPDLMNYTAMGDAVNVAKRLEQSARPDQVLLGPETYAMTQHETRAHPLGPVTLKGRRAPVQVYELLGYRSRAKKEKR